MANLCCFHFSLSIFPYSKTKINPDHSRTSLQFYPTYSMNSTTNYACDQPETPDKKKLNNNLNKSALGAPMLNRPLGSNINPTGFGNFGVQPSIPPMMQQQSPFQGLNRGINSAGLPNLPPPPPLLPGQKSSTGLTLSLNNPTDQINSIFNRNSLPNNQLPIPPVDNLMPSRMNNSNNTTNLNGKRSNNLGKFLFACCVFQIQLLEISPKRELLNPFSEQYKACYTKTKCIFII